MRLYNLSAANYALINVALQRIKVSRIEDLNDSFELLGANLRDKRLRKPFRDAKRQIHDDNGVICFSETWQNPVMWSHYGEKHAGICLGFDVRDDLVMPVTYATEPLKIESPESPAKFTTKQLTEKFVTRLLSLKFRDWGYEREKRIFVRLDHSTSEGGLYFYEFSQDLQLREIILGARCDVPIEKARELAGRFSHKVHVMKARIAFTKFSVVENRRY